MPGADPTHWLHRFTADEWLRAGMRELATARSAIAGHHPRPALAGLRRAAGMGWNAVLALEPEPDAAFGRTYADHWRAIADGAEPHGAPIPEAVRAAAKLLMDDPVAQAKPSGVVQILTRTRDERVIEAAETVLAEAYTRLLHR
jgi:hypothetical protein